MSVKSLKSCIKVLNLLAKCRSKKRRKKLLKKCDKKALIAISDIAHNVLNGNFPIESENFHKLSKFKNPLRQLVNKKLSRTSKMRIINNQVGGFLPALLIPALSIIGQLITEKLMK